MTPVTRATSPPIPAAMPATIPVTKTTPSPTSSPSAKPTLAPSAPQSPNQSVGPSIQTAPSSISSVGPSTPGPSISPDSIKQQTTPESSTDKKDCFAGSETVTVESVGATPISRIRIGDRVLACDAAGRTLYSDVVFVPHGPNKDSALFVHITTDSGRDIRMTANHIIPSGACGNTAFLSLSYARNVNAGDCIMTVSGEERISAVGVVSGQGLYTIVTKEEYLVVNGIIASPFAVNHMMANLYYNLHRFVHALVPSVLKLPFLHSTNEVRQ